MKQFALRIAGAIIVAAMSTAPVVVTSAVVSLMMADAATAKGKDGGHGAGGRGGHANPTHAGIDHWWIIDIKAFRAALTRQTNNGSPIYMSDQANPDGTCFKWFDIRSDPAHPPMVVARSTC